VLVRDGEMHFVETYNAGKMVLKDTTRCIIVSWTYSVQQEGIKLFFRKLLLYKMIGLDRNFFPDTSDITCCSNCFGNKRAYENLLESKKAM
jgi:hypothetical protein